MMSISTLILATKKKFQKARTDSAQREIDWQRHASLLAQAVAQHEEERAQLLTDQAWLLREHAEADALFEKRKPIVQETLALLRAQARSDAADIARNQIEQEAWLARRRLQASTKTADPQTPLPISLPQTDRMPRITAQLSDEILDGDPTERLPALRNLWLTDEHAEPRALLDRLIVSLSDAFEDGCYRGTPLIGYVTFPDSIASAE